MKKYKFGICGHFGGNKVFLDGQTIKTKEWKCALEKNLKSPIMCVDTYNWKQRKFKLFTDCMKLSKECENIIILPARPGIKVIAPLFILGKVLYKCKVHYIVIGGWIAEYLKDNPFLYKICKKMDTIHVEGKAVLEKLKQLNLTNVYLTPNFKNIEPVNIDDFRINNTEKIYKICTCSRVIKEKGIEDIINVVKKINMENGKTILELDIYGPIDKNYASEFNNIMDKLPNYIKYKGSIDSNKTVDILRTYYLLAFPTKYPGEGLPGTILDAYFAGLPVIASRWNSYKDIIDEGVTGITYEFNNLEDLELKLKYVIENKNIIFDMKKKCVLKSHDYLPSKIVNEFLERTNAIKNEQDKSITYNS